MAARLPHPLMPAVVVVHKAVRAAVAVKMEARAVVPVAVMVVAGAAQQVAPVVVATAAAGAAPAAVAQVEMAVDEVDRGQVAAVLEVHRVVAVVHLVVGEVVADDDSPRNFCEQQCSCAIWICSDGDDLGGADDERHRHGSGGIHELRRR